MIKSNKKSIVKCHLKRSLTMKVLKTLLEITENKSLNKSRTKAFFLAGLVVPVLFKLKWKRKRSI